MIQPRGTPRKERPGEMAGGRPFMAFGRVEVQCFLYSLTQGPIRINLIHQSRELDEEPPTP
jgi:hypothetical protein